MTNARDEMEKLVQKLEQQRGELQLKMSLAKLEAREEWENLEKQWEQIKLILPQLRDEFGSTTGNVGASLSKAAGEIRDGYARLRKLL